MIRRPRYRRNRTPRNLQFGKKVQDAISGAWTYELRLVTDYEGNRVDPRFGTLDYPKEDRGAVP